MPLPRFAEKTHRGLSPSTPQNHEKMVAERAQARPAADATLQPSEPLRRARPASRQVRRRNEGRVAQAAFQAEGGSERAGELPRREVAHRQGAGGFIRPGGHARGTPAAAEPPRRLTRSQPGQAPGDFPRTPPIHDGTEERRAGWQQRRQVPSHVRQLRLAVQRPEVAVCAIESGAKRPRGKKAGGVDRGRRRDEPGDPIARRDDSRRLTAPVRSWPARCPSRPPPARPQPTATPCHPYHSRFPTGGCLGERAGRAARRCHPPARP